MTSLDDYEFFILFLFENYKWFYTNIYVTLRQT